MATKQKIAPVIKDNETLSALVREALRDVFEERKTIFAASQLDNVTAPRVTTVPNFKRIEDYTGAELDAAIGRGEAQMGKECFWQFLNGVDAFFERRRRERGYGFIRSQADTWRR